MHTEDLVKHILGMCQIRHLIINDRYKQHTQAKAAKLSSLPSIILGTFKANSSLL